MHHSFFLFSLLFAFLISCQEKDNTNQKKQEQVLIEKTKNHPVAKLFEGKTEDEKQAVAESLYLHMLDTSKTIDSLKTKLTHFDNYHDSLLTMFQAVEQDNRMIMNWWLTQRNAEWWEQNPYDFDESGNSYLPILLNPLSYSLYLGKPEVADFLNGKGFWIKFDYRHIVHANAIDYFINDQQGRGINKDSVIDSLLHTPAVLSDTLLFGKLLTLGADPNKNIRPIPYDPSIPFHTPIEIAASGPLKLLKDQPRNDSINIELLAKYGVRYDMLDTNGQYKVINALMSDFECDSGFDCENSRFTRFMALRNIGVQFNRRDQHGNLFINQMKAKGLNVLLSKTLPLLLEDKVDTSAFKHKLRIDSCGFAKQDPQGFFLFQNIQTHGEENFSSEVHKMIRTSPNDDFKEHLITKQGIVHDVRQQNFWCFEKHVVFHSFGDLVIYNAPGSENSFKRVVTKKARWVFHNKNPHFLTYIQPIKNTELNFQVSVLDLSQGNSLLEKEIKVGFNPEFEPPQVEYKKKHNGIAIRFLNDTSTEGPKEKVFKLKFQ